MKKRKIFIGGIIAGILGISLALFLVLTLPANTLTLDINPSIQITTNRLNNVVSVEPLNQDAQDLLKEFTLRDKDLDDVLNELTDLMILTGHITGGQDNMVMITVKDDNADPQLLNKVNQMIAAYLQNKQIEATIFSQSVAYKQSEVKAAKEYGVSPGRMQIIQKLISKDEKLSMETLTSISLSELLVTAKELNMDPEVLFNQMIQRIAQEKGELKQVYRDDVRDDDRKEDSDDDRNEVRDASKDNDSKDDKKDATPSKKKSQQRQMISHEKAKEIALTKVNGKIVEFELDEDDGSMIYEIEIKKDGMEYEIEIDAYTGNIIKYEVDRDDDREQTKPSKQKSQKKQLISSEKAMEIALAKVNGKIVEFELDDDDGSMIYEIEIKKDGMEYEIEIDAYSGKIIEFEMDD